MKPDSWLLPTETSQGKHWQAGEAQLWPLTSALDLFIQGRVRDQS